MFKQTKPEEIDLSALDKESAYRRFSGMQNTLLTIALVCFTLFQLFSSLTGRVPQQQVRYIHLGFAITLSYWLYPFSVKGKRDSVHPLDYVFMAMFVAVISYCMINFVALQNRAGSYTTLDVVFGAIAILLILEACRRVVGLPIVIIACVFIVYALAGAYMPGFLRHRGYSLKRVITHLFYTTEGVIGTPIGACATFIFLFILFGSFLEKTGIGQFFINIANALAGWATGGPAKVAVLSSALQGTVSGSSVANTVSTGSFTIPLMKSLGYKPEFAGAVEAAASTGGQIMPPIMGAAAFLISEAVGVPYINVATAAIVPALLYFSGIWIMVHLEAKRLGLKGVPRDQLPKAGKLMKEQGHLLAPLIVIIGLLVLGFTTTRAALLGSLTCIIVPFLRKSTRVPVRDILDAIPQAARSILSVACACGVAGIIVGIVTLTGLGLKMGEGLTSLTGGLLLPTLFFAMLTSIILGMGVPTTANYLITSTIAAPILVKLGVPILAAHMFCFYFGIVADITPPVALAAYAGSAIAKGDPFKTGVNAAKLAIAAFLVPYLFVLNPEMILIGATPLNVIRIIITAMCGMIGIGAGLTGFFLSDLRWYERLILIAGGLSLLDPGMVTDIIGVVVVVLMFVWQKFNLTRNAKTS